MGTAPGFTPSISSVNSARVMHAGRGRKNKRGAPVGRGLSSGRGDEGEAGGTDEARRTDPRSAGQHSAGDGPCDGGGGPSVLPHVLCLHGGGLGARTPRTQG